jgi:hypothetical protein
MQMLHSILFHSDRRIICRRKYTPEPLKGSLPWLTIRDTMYDTDYHILSSIIGKQRCIKIKIVNAAAWAYEAFQRSQLHVVDLVNNVKSFQFKLYISGDQ